MASPPALERRLAEQHEAILAAWRALVFASYPEGAARLLRRAPDPFRNPLGQRIHDATAAVLDAITGVHEPVGRRADVQAGAPGPLGEILDPLVRVAAVQGQPPSVALGFVFALKRALRDALGDALAPAEWAALDERVDGLALAAFDAYCRCREEVADIRVRGAQRRVAALLRAVDMDREGASRAQTMEREAASRAHPPDRDAVAGAERP